MLSILVTLSMLHFWTGGKFYEDLAETEFPTFNSYLINSFIYLLTVLIFRILV
jgi:hypothetical protein